MVAQAGKLLRLEDAINSTSGLLAVVQDVSAEEVGGVDVGVADVVQRDVEEEGGVEVAGLVQDGQPVSAELVMRRQRCCCCCCCCFI